MEIEQISISLPDQREFSVLVEPGNGHDLALVLPGLNYGCERPLLAGAIQVFKEQGADILSLNFSYNTDAEFLAMADADQLATIMADGRAIVSHCLGLSQYRQVNLIGKSLGTISMGGLEPYVMPENSRMIWLTPSLTGTGLLERMVRFNCKKFSLIGSRDPSVQITRSAEYRRIFGLTHLEVAGMDHGWDHSDGVQAGEIGLEKAISGLRNWL